MADLVLYIDPTQRTLVDSLASRSPLVPQPVTLGDGVAVELYAPADLTGWTAAAGQISIGRIDAGPSQGTYTLTWDSNTSNAIDYAAAASTVQTALTSMAGGPAVTVSGPNGGPYLVSWNAVGARNSISGNPAGLYPTSTISVAEAQAGNASTIEQQVITVRQALTSANAFSTLNAGNATVTTIIAGGGGQNEVQQIAFSSHPYAGTFRVAYNGATTNALPVGATASEVQNALQAIATIGGGNCVVSTIANGYQVQFSNGLANTNVAAITVDTNATTFAVGRSTTLNLNTFNLAALVGTNDAVNLTIEGQFTLGGLTKTLFQAPISVKNDLIDTSAISPTGSGYPAPSAIPTDLGTFGTYNSMLATTPSVGTDRVVIATVNNDGTGAEYSGLWRFKSGTRPAESAPFVLHFTDNSNTYLSLIK